ncbi:MAG: hypothetical protein A2087_08135 [Spirochaetes bacterium GWD1_61_31]|nr:MAG: hypothetical protein A2Y37_03930 [Spirochaetes bacterium GWB1_60_80]OHD28834.1 MAG: hypothetical protein A2004_08360 [Spirochaetes bacterium GWC1_61_12]OHD42147.1 MAG: hypothetical protein A2087_08135 [Spirochaetes bacterium GWD1_61_31]OHD45432.1 MAG: hypothetical protein A2Y35_06400 [Spirochaetes bacterium GWE1_60_18]OHD61526.1 MAG: hypothetical protein A2Y32_09430 [Spirochaetes bacterium GWF1_60_12]HAP43254.1 hypothetical protein [Spirochaetaceae bacterium]
MSNQPFWEQPGRNPVVAAFVLCALIMAVYGFLGSTVSGGLVFIDTIGDILHDSGAVGTPDAKAGDILEMMAQVYRRYQVPILVLTTLLQFAVFFGLTALVFRAWHGRPIGGYFRLGRPRPLALLLAGLGTVCLLPVAIFLGELASRALPILRQLEGIGNALVEADSPAEWALVIFAIGVTPALCEEFLFRGYFQRTLDRGLRQPWSYIVSGLFFALIHQNYFGLAALSLVGIFLGFVFARFGSFWPGVAVHGLYNGVQVIMANRPAWFGWLFDANGFVRLPLAGLGLVGFLLVAWLIIRLTRPEGTLAAAPETAANAALTRPPAAAASVEATTVNHD